MQNERVNFAVMEVSSWGWTEGRFSRDLYLFYWKGGRTESRVCDGVFRCRGVR
jgi:hypothetical protein